MNRDVTEAILLVVMGGLFGYLLGRLPERWVYVIAGFAIILGVIVIGGLL